MKYLIYVIVICSLSCDKKKTTPLIGNEITYQIVSSVNKSNLIIHRAGLKADTTGRLYLHLELLNNTKNQLFISPAAWELVTENGLRSPAQAIEDTVITLPPGLPRSANFVFNPINSLFFYRLTDLKGDLGQRYQLIFKEKLITITFSLSVKVYRLYKEKWGMEPDVSIFSLNTLPEFKKKEIGYLENKILLNQGDAPTTKHGVHASGQEILVDGLNTSFFAYILNDTLKIKMRLTNHSPFATSFKTSTLKVQLGNATTILPLLDYGIDSLYIPRSERAFIKLNYLLPSNYLEADFKMDISSFIFYTPKPISIFYEKWLVFKKVNLTVMY